MQAAKQLDMQFQSNPQSAHLEKVLMSKTLPKRSQPVKVEYSDISIESRLEAECDLEERIMKMFGYK